MIELDPNSWLDAEWWYEDEPEIIKFMQDHEFEIKQYVREHNITIKDGIDYLYEKQLKEGKN